MAVGWSRLATTEEKNLSAHSFWLLVVEECKMNTDSIKEWNLKICTTLLVVCSICTTIHQ